MREEQWQHIRLIEDGQCDLYDNQKECVSVYWMLSTNSHFDTFDNPKSMNFKHCVNDFGDIHHNRSADKILKIQLIFVKGIFIVIWEIKAFYLNTSESWDVKRKISVVVNSMTFESESLTK